MLQLLTVVIITNLFSCGNSKQNSDENNNTNSIQTSPNKTNMISQKITPSIWVETTDAKAVADYYLSIFKDSKLKEHHKCTNPPEAGGGDFETAVIEIAGMELSILAAGPFRKFNESVSLVINTKDQAETSVLFELIGARYERRSILITANQPFGEWGKIFPDQAMTLAAVDRLVHHATILEMNVESYRRRAAIERRQGPGRSPSRATTKNSS